MFHTETKVEYVNRVYLTIFGKKIHISAPYLWAKFVDMAALGVVVGGMVWITYMTGYFFDRLGNTSKVFLEDVEKLCKEDK